MIKFVANVKDRIYKSEHWTTNGHWMLSNEFIKAQTKCKKNGKAFQSLDNLQRGSYSFGAHSEQERNLDQLAPKVTKAWETINSKFHQNAAGIFDESGKLTGIGFRLKGKGFVFVSPDYAALIKVAPKVKIDPSQKEKETGHYLAQVALCDQNDKVIGVLMPQRARN